MTSDAIAHTRVAFPRRGVGRQVDYFEYRPLPELSAAIEYCWVLRANEPFATPMATRSPGKGSVDLIFPMEGHFCEDGERHLFGNGAAGAYLVGPLSLPAKVVSSGRCSAVGVRFRPGYSRSILRFPIHEIQNGLLSMESLGGGFARKLVDRVSEQTTLENQVQALQRSLLELHRQDTQTVVSFAIDLIEAHHGSISVDFVAERTGVSVRTLERLFRDSVGLSPKQLCRIVRVRHAASLLTRDRPRWADVAQACGYADQAHFIREFKAIVGVLPSVFLEERAKPCPQVLPHTLCRKSSIHAGVGALT